MRVKDDFTIIASHDAFRGPYSVLQRFRQAVVGAYGKQYNMDYFYPEGHPGLSAFLTHNSSDKWIEPDVCARIANELEALLPHLEAASADPGSKEYADLARQFIAGCRKATQANDPLTFEDDLKNAFGPWHKG